MRGTGSDIQKSPGPRLSHSTPISPKEHQTGESTNCRGLWGIRCLLLVRSALLPPRIIAAIKILNIVGGTLRTRVASKARRSDGENRKERNESGGVLHSEDIDITIR